MSARLQERLAAIEALAGGRIDDAAAIIQQLQQAPVEIRRGVCRMCGCSEARACGILVLDSDSGVLDAVMEPRVERCSWADEEATVCTNVSCLERWRKESPAEMDVDIHDVVEAAAPRSRIILP